jgi:CRP/FNR family cyclic AMP-dependent transcriptional regulator
MASSSVITRFQGDEGKRRFQNLLERQIIAGGDPTIAADLAEVATCHEISPGDVLIVSGAADNDLFLILQGAFRIIVNGRDVAVRKPGHHVGEMAIIDSSAARSASVVASEPGVVAKISEEDFVQLLEKHPRIWRSLAIELCQRLREREKFHREPNQKPIIFIGSSKECLDIAEAVRNAIPGTSAAVSIWSEDVFTASGLTLESLEAQLVTADFAVLIDAKARVASH